MGLNKFLSLALIIFSIYSLLFPFVTPEITPSTENPSPEPISTFDDNPSRGITSSSAEPTPANNRNSKTKPSPTSSPAVKPSQMKCSVDDIKLEVCVDLLVGLLDLKIGDNLEDHPCCPVIQGLAGLEASICICTIVKGNPLGALRLNILLTLLLNLCGLQPLLGFDCI
ncbi:hypothetical protein RND81_08G128800 [Saponaria officinalis]|uniref:Bifunctional inhibitor/plant lipid transfer protein/seed storage helical domain-containing protein n=1 Tax=Saponaria officinalis TaxID=3572 RepID=A0AAW1JA82_SAPOF